MSRFSECITPEGFAGLQAEHDQLWKVERPQVVKTVSWAAGNGDRSENGDYIYGKKRLRQIDSRVRYLRKRLESLNVVDPGAQKNRDQVFFGATVRYERENGKVLTVTLVGRDETDGGPPSPPSSPSPSSAIRRITLDSPVGRALMNKTVGALVVVHTPGGEEELEVMDISYPKPAR
jgi:transcription elongation factor GreB